MKTFIKFLIPLALLAVIFNGCRKDLFEEAALEVVATSDIVPNEGSVADRTITISVKSNTFWAVAVRAPEAIDTNGWAVISQLSGDGDGVISILVNENPEQEFRSMTLTFRAEHLTHKIHISQGKVPVTLFYEDFGTGAPTASPWPSLTDWKNYSRQGLGGANVAYTSEGSGAVTIRGSSVSSGYQDASGEANAMMASTGATLVVKNIASCGARNLTLTFGTNQNQTVLTVFLSPDNGTTWDTLKYTKATIDAWGLVRIPIVLPENTDCFALRFTAGTTGFGTRVDDIKITTRDDVGLPSKCDGSGPDPVGELIYSDNFGTAAPASAPFPSVAEYTGWDRKGSSAATIIYEGTNASVRSSGVSSGYRGASGGANVMFSSAEGGTLIIDGIKPDGKQYMFLSFGTNQTNLIMAASYSADGGAWVPIPFTKNTETWGLVEVGFEIPANTTTLKLRFNAGTTQFGARIDDVSLLGSDEPFPQISVSTNLLEFVMAGEAKKFTVTSNVAWNATSSDQTNFAVSISGNEVTVTATENTTGATRNATVEVKSLDGRVSQTVALTQAGGNNVVLATWDFSSRTALNATTGAGTISRPPGTPGDTLIYHSGERSVRTTNWLEIGSAYWLMTIPVSVNISGNVNVSFSSYGSSTGPGQWKVQVSSDNINWADGDTYNLGTSTTAMSDFSINATLLAAIPSGGTLYLRLIPRSAVSVGGGNVAAGGTNRIAKITVSN